MEEGSRRRIDRGHRGPPSTHLQGVKETLVPLHPKGLRNRFPYLRFSFQELSQTGQDSAETQLKRRLIASEDD